MTKKKTIVVVDDEKPLAKALSLKFENKGFKAEVAHDGKVALNLILKGVDAVVLDLMMPVMDGFALMEAVKKEGIKIPMFITTNLSQPEDKERATASGAVGFFVKSNTSINEIVDTVISKL